MTDDLITRKVGDWVITHSMHIGDKEVVLGENNSCPDKPRYVCAYYQSNALIAQYSEVQGSNDYLEIMELYLERLGKQVETVKKERDSITVPTELLTAEQCEPNSLDESINGKIIALRMGTLRPEYQTADNQILLVTGGFGASPNARGSAVYVHNLYSGVQYRVERSDVLGVVKPEQIPAWAVESAAKIQAKNMKKAVPER